MSELDELTDGKNWDQLLKELLYQLDNGEKPGGEIVSHVHAACSKAAPGFAGRLIADNIVKYHDVEKETPLYYAVHRGHAIGYVYVDIDYNLRFCIMRGDKSKGADYAKDVKRLYIYDGEGTIKATAKDFEEYGVKLPPDFSKLLEQAISVLQEIK